MQIFINEGISKRCKWTSTRNVVNIDTKFGTVTVPGRYGKQGALRSKMSVLLEMRTNYQ